MLWAALDAGDEGLVRRIFGFAERCAARTARELWDAAGVAFYEHLFDYPAYSERVVPWLSPRLVHNPWRLWEAIVAPAEWARIALWLKDKRAAGERQALSKEKGLQCEPGRIEGVLRAKRPKRLPVVRTCLPEVAGVNRSCVPHAGSCFRSTGSGREYLGGRAASEGRQRGTPVRR